MFTRHTVAFAALAGLVLAAGAASAMELRGGGNARFLGLGAEADQVAADPNAPAVVSARVIDIRGGGETVEIIYGTETQPVINLPVAEVRQSGENVQILYFGTGGDVVR